MAVVNCFLFAGADVNLADAVRGLGGADTHDLPRGW